MKKKCAMAAVALAFVGCLAGGASGETFAIAGVTMTPSLSTASYTNSDLELTPAIGAYSFRAPVHLPDGATITQVELHCSDTSVANNMSCTLTRMTGSAVFVVTSCTSAGSGGSQSSASPLISHSVQGSNGYAVRVSGNCDAEAAHEIRLVRVTYTPPPAAALCPGDANGDNIVNSADLSVLLAQFGNVCTP